MLTGFAPFVLPLLVFLFCSLSAGAASDKVPDKTTGNPATHHLETFDAAWRIIDETYYDANFNGLDWDAVGEEFRPKAARAASRQELRDVLQDMLDRLGDSHMAVIASEVARTVEPNAGNRSNPGGGTDDSLDPAGGGDLGLDVRRIDQRMVVVNVERDGPSDRAGVKPGWTILRIGTDPVAEILTGLPEGLSRSETDFLSWRTVSSRFQGRPGSEVEVTFENRRNRPVRRELVRHRQSGERAKLGNLPVVYTRFESRSMETANGAKVGLIRFNFWMVPATGAFDRAIDEFRGADAVIVDLRGNLGGIGGMIMGIAGHFLDEAISLGTMTMRDAELRFLANPRRVNPQGERVKPFAGPVAIVIDGLTLSASEIFAGGMQAVGRATVIGETSGGQALPALFDRLPNGDVLYHAVADFVTPNGTRLEGRGVRPDIEVAPDRRALLAGRDPAIEEALRWVDGQLAGVKVNAE